MVVGEAGEMWEKSMISENRIDEDGTKLTFPSVALLGAHCSRDMQLINLKITLRSRVRRPQEQLFLTLSIAQSVVVII